VPYSTWASVERLGLRSQVTELECITKPVMHDHCKASPTVTLPTAGHHCPEPYYRVGQKPAHFENFITPVYTVSTKKTKPTTF